MLHFLNLALLLSILHSQVNNYFALSHKSGENLLNFCKINSVETNNSFYVGHSVTTKIDNFRHNYGRKLRAGTITVTKVITEMEYLDDPPADEGSNELQSVKNVSVSQRRKSRHFDEDIVYQDTNSTAAVNETVLVGSLQHLSPAVSYSKDSKSFSSLFRTFSFKGIGYCFTKSVIEWQTVGLGIRLPITPNFPNYDSIIHLPRVGIFIGLFYPQGVAKVNLSMSIPLQTAFTALIKLLIILLRKKKRHIQASISISQNESIEPADGKDGAPGSKVPATATKAALRRSISNSHSHTGSNEEIYVADEVLNYLKRLRKKLKVTDSVRRIGVTLSLKIDPRRGMQWGFGPWMFYVPGRRILQHLLPVVLLCPTILLTVASILAELTGGALRLAREALPRSRAASVTFESGAKKKSRTSKLTAETRRKKPSSAAKLLAASAETAGPADRDSDCSEAMGMAAEETARPWNIAGTVSSFREVCGGVVQSYNHWRKYVSAWADSKTTGIGYNIGWHHSRRFGGCSAGGPLLLSSAAGDHCSDSAMSSGAMGSSVQFDVTPFYPFHEFFSKLSAAHASHVLASRHAHASRLESRAIPQNDTLRVEECIREDDEAEDSKALLLEPPLQS